MNEDKPINSTQSVTLWQDQNENYFQLVWRRFRRSKASIVGGMMVLMLIILALFAEFFSPNNIYEINLKASFIPPQVVHFIDHEGKFHLQPFVYNFVYTLDPKTFRVMWTEDTQKIYFLRFFVQGPEYKMLGLIPSKLHLFGVDEGGTVYILGTDKMGRDCGERPVKPGASP